ncbi:efflux RND transporter periplasmic adaptor subunit [Fulvivirgaceae bacterium PWU4]|uniref:Efflux RND transporter periplasmic adaptor subunit n=1 Tax=Chryseosolibacter histidini TaxID=2782349 RepID=A0AAP2DFL5_9BACT|nr:efflux RND transporter periplasmic adaptor subunit [Chryseosolibacter histidini]MBT1695310.1 efflux RND transporter periplasmic adaptor subunit [Chryseosolibacter histidini]
MNQTRDHIQSILFSTTLLLLAGWLSSCMTSEGNNNDKKSDAALPRAVEVAAVEKGMLTSSLAMPGELISFQQVDLYARETSFVKKIYVDVGSEVREGQVLATLEAPELSSRLAGAESRWKSQEAVYTASKASYERLLETSKTPGTISPNELEQALARMNSDFSQLEATKAAYKEVSNTLNYLTIKAPFSGVISARNVNPGAYVGPSGKGSENPLFTLQEQNRLRLVVSVPEAYTAYLREDDKVNFQIKALPNESFEAKVKRMAGALDTRLRSQRVEMDVINNNRNLLPGMVAQVTIPLLNRDSTLIVPKTAIVNSPEKVFVISVRDNKAIWITVQTGRTVDGKTEIYGKLQPGDQVVKVASEEIRDGMAVSAGQ